MSEQTLDLRQTIDVPAHENPYAAQRFARGYIARTGDAPKAPTGWLRREFAGLHVAHDPRLTATTGREQESEVLCLGLLFDVREPNRSTLECIVRLTNALFESEDSFLSQLQYTCGRYVFIYKRSDLEAKAVSDATGMKCIFYGGEVERNVSSHVELIANNEPSAIAVPPLRFKYGYPGIGTPREGIRLLTPNTTLDIKTFHVRRFWPLRPLKECPLDDAVTVVMNNMNNAARHVGSRFRLLVSVTAGLDSRTTLSSILPLPGVRYFTYFTNAVSPSMKIDKVFCATLRDAGILDVDLISTQSTCVDENFNDIIKMNTIGEHSIKLAYEYYKKFSSCQNLIHVRSNLAEIGREFWGVHRFDLRSATDMARIYINDKKNTNSDYTFKIIDEFNLFASTNNFFDAINYVDSKSLFYWEFRMASWHAQLISESDPAFETISLFNCRHSLAAMLSVSQEHRAKGDVQKAVIARNAPDLTKYRINGRPFWS